MAQAETYEDDLDAFFSAADSGNAQDIRLAAENVVRNTAVSDASGDEDFITGADVLDPDSPDYALRGAVPETGGGKTRKKRRRTALAVARSDNPFEIPAGHEALLTGGEPGDLEGKFIAVEADGDSEEPFVLIPANIHAFVPLWGWVGIAVGLAMLVTGVLFLPKFTLDRLAAGLGDPSEANAQYAMRKLILNGDKRTVQKLFSLASSGEEKLAARLRAIDTMSLIEEEPEVDRALLRLELSSGTSEQVREAAVAARKQREAARSRPRAEQ